MDFIIKSITTHLISYYIDYYLLTRDIIYKINCSVLNPIPFINLNFQLLCISKSVYIRLNGYFKDIVN